MNKKQITKLNALICPFESPHISDVKVTVQKAVSLYTPNSTYLCSYKHAFLLIHFLTFMALVGFLFNDISNCNEHVFSHILCFLPHNIK